MKGVSLPQLGDLIWIHVHEFFKRFIFIGHLKKSELPEYNQTKPKPFHSDSHAEVAVEGC